MSINNFRKPTNVTIFCLQWILALGQENGIATLSPHRKLTGCYSNLFQSMKKVDEGDFKKIWHQARTSVIFRGWNDSWA